MSLPLAPTALGFNAAARERGAPHASELAYLFGTLPARYLGAVAPQDQAASTLFRQAIARFAQAGDPNGPGLPAWPRHDGGHEGIMLFGREGGAQFGPDPWRDRLDMVERAQRSPPPVSAAP